MDIRSKPKQRKPVIALAQIRYSGDKKKSNTAKIKRYIAMAAKAGADIICFPESCIHKTGSIEMNHEFLNEIREASKENKIWTIVTDTFKVADGEYNMAVLINRKGDIKGSYKKINLYGDETLSGKKTFVFKTDFGKIGIAICWDLAFPELFHKMKKRGAEIIFCPAHWCYEYKAHTKDHVGREKKLIKSMMLARAFENLFFVAVVNPIDGAPGLVSYSALSSPHRIMKDLSGKEGMIIKRINLSEIKKFEKLYPNKKPVK